MPPECLWYSDLRQLSYLRIQFRLFRTKGEGGSWTNHKSDVISISTVQLGTQLFIHKGVHSPLGDSPEVLLLEILFTVSLIIDQNG